MNFDKNKFIKEKGQTLYSTVIDFLDSENNGFILQDIKNLLLLDNVKRFAYEGNIYVVEKNIDDEMILIIDEISERNGVSKDQTIFKLNIREFIEIISEAEEILANK